MENVSLEVTATCGLPPDLRGRKVQDIHILKSCPENISPSEKTSVVDPKVDKSKPNALKSQKVKASSAQPKPRVSKPLRKQPQRKPGTQETTKNKKILK